MEIILIAIPFFFLLIGIELVAERVRGTNYYRLNDAITSLNAGILSQLMGLLRLAIPFTIYVLVYEKFSFWQLEESSFLWVVSFVAYDFCYYWKHRYGHEMNIMWAAHVVHHSSEEYNLTTALRQTSGSNIGFVFYLPLALLGISPIMLATVGALNLVYQYWVHTRHIGKLGWMEWVFVTPSNHRGHHAQNSQYIDKNYGGVFILWDRLFGTFREEDEYDPPIFGIRGALRSWNPLWANLQVFHQLWMDCIHTQHWWYRLTIWFRRTGWRPPDVVEKYPLVKTDLAHFEKYDTPLNANEKWYAFLQYLSNTSLVLALLLNFDALSHGQAVFLGLVIVISSYTTGAFLERAGYRVVCELLKQILVLAALWICALPAMVDALIMFLILASLILLAMGDFSRQKNLIAPAITEPRLQD